MEQHPLQQEIVHEEDTKEVTTETETGNIPNTPIQPSVDVSGEKKEKRKRLSKIHFQKKEKTPEQKKKHLFHRKKDIFIEGVTITPDLQKQVEELVDESMLQQSTFTLRFDDKGNLVGYNLKKPKPPKEQKQETAAPEPEAKGVKGKIKRVFSKIRRKKSLKEGGSRMSGIGGKLKGIVPRRSKK